MQGDFSPIALDTQRFSRRCSAVLPQFLSICLKPKEKKIMVEEK